MSALSTGPTTQTLPDDREAHKAHNSFDVDSTRVLTDLRNALSDVIKGLPGHASKPADVQRVVKVAPAIGWGVYKAATASNPMEVGLYVPKSKAMKQFLVSAQKNGVPREAIEAAQRCLWEFESLVQRHASDREVFEAMVADFTEGDRRDASSSKARKAAFKANVLLWGRQASATVGVSILHPGADGQSIEQAVVSGTTNLCQTRRDVVLRMTRSHRVLPQDGEPSLPAFEPLDERTPDGQPSGLLHDFCSGELPEFRSCGGQGRISYELRAQGLGRGAAFTLMNGFLVRSAGPRHIPGFAVSTYVNTPSEVAIFHVLMHDSLWNATPPRVTVHEPGTEFEAMKNGFSILPQNEQARYLGRGVKVCETTDDPQHAEMLQWVVGKLGWPAESFNAFRLRIEYPIVGCKVRLAFDQ